MQVAAIVPVKAFSKAKTRLSLPQTKIEQICAIMLDEVLSAISQSQIGRIIIVSSDENAFQIGKKYGAVPIVESVGNGVNHAVALGEEYLIENGFKASVVFPQDIPLVRPLDVNNLLGFQKNGRSLMIVPSRRFDGTNALFRSPVNIIETHYDEDSYKIHLSTGKSRNIPTSFVLIKRIMLDVDDKSDIELIMSNIEKPSLADKMRQILES